MTGQIVFVMTMTGLLGAGFSRAQSATPHPAFEVASVKPSACTSGGLDMTPGRMNWSCISLRNLIQTAYRPVVRVRPFDVLGGPAWLDSDRYDISAKAEGVASNDEMMGPMLRLLLEERFKVKAHLEPRDSPVYALTVAKNGPKLKPSKEGSCIPMDLNQVQAPPQPGEPQPKYCGMGGRKLNADGVMVGDWQGLTMGQFADRILAGSGQLDRPAVDKTGLTGLYDIHLEYTPGSEVMAPVGSVSIFTAIQEELGLKLTSDKAPVEVIVVDHAEKPSDN